MVEYLRSAQQAADAFSFDGGSPAKPKSLFAVHFVRGGAAPSEWLRGLTFLAKSVDRPAVQPKTETLHQYNRKRLVHTGYEMQPVKATIYDTADSAALMMWDEYSKHYFGDFNQDAGTYRYDVTTPGGMIDSGAGFGTIIPQSQVAPTDAHFFFDRVEIFHMFGGSCVQYDLINPRITSFDPDDLDYENSNPAMITLTFAYEAIVYRPNQSVEGSPIAEIFSGAFQGGLLEVSGPAAQDFRRSGSGGNQPLGITINPMGQSTTTMRSPSTARTGGSVSPFGNLSFGTAANVLVNRLARGGGKTDTRSLVSDLAYAATGSTSLATVLNIGKSKNKVADLASAALAQVDPVTSGVNPALYDAAHNALGASRIGAGTTGIAASLVGGVLTAARANRTAPGDQFLNTRQTNGTGLRLSQDALGAMNARRPAHSQIGVMQPNTTTYSDGTVIRWNQ